MRSLVLISLIISTFPVFSQNTLAYTPITSETTSLPGDESVFLDTKTNGLLFASVKIAYGMSNVKSNQLFAGSRNNSVATYGVSFEFKPAGQLSFSAEFLHEERGFKKDFYRLSANGDMNKVGSKNYVFSYFSVPISATYYVSTMPSKYLRLGVNTAIFRNATLDIPPGESYTNVNYWKEINPVESITKVDYSAFVELGHTQSKTGRFQMGLRLQRSLNSSVDNFFDYASMMYHWSAMAHFSLGINIMPNKRQSSLATTIE